MKWSLLFLLGVLFHTAPRAQPLAQFLIDKAAQLQLAKHPQWIRLVHYHANWLNDGMTSQADDPDFFLAPQGKYDPEAELAYSIQALLTGDNDALLCRFPARRHWLAQQLAQDLSTLYQPHCPEYDTYRQQVSASSVSLIFPAAYLNSPSSMFGHTFLRLDPEVQQSALRAQAVNFAADTSARDSELFYAAKGLFGGYPGYFSVVPYHKKVKEYNALENRDIWEYRLNLTAAEIELMVQHLWELEHIRFDYFFTSQNCSYQLMALLSVVRPEQDLTSDFDIRAIPVDTVRLLQQKGWIQDRAYRPSNTTVFHAFVSDLTPDEQESVVQLAALQNVNDLDRLLAPYTHEKQAQLLESAYKLVRLRAQKDTSDQEASAKGVISHQLLLRRSQLGHTGNPPPILAPTPAEEGHQSQQMAIGISATSDATQLNLDYKPAFHSLLDNANGYSAGSEINFLAGRISLDHEKLWLEQLQILSIRSFSNRDDFLQPWSWQVALGWQRETLWSDDAKGELVGYLNAAAGQTYALSSMQRVYMLYGGLFEQGYQAFDSPLWGPQIITGWLWQTPHVAAQIEARYAYFVEQESERWELTTGLSFPVTQEQAVQLKYHYRQQDTQHQGRAELLFSQHF